MFPGSCSTMVSSQLILTVQDLGHQPWLALSSLVASSSCLQYEWSWDRLGWSWYESTSWR